MSIESAMPSNHLIPCRPLLLLPSISFQMSQLFAETHLCLDNLALGSHVLRPRDQGGSSRSRAGAVCLASGLTASTWKHLLMECHPWYWNKMTIYVYWIIWVYWTSHIESDRRLHEFMTYLNTWVTISSLLKFSLIKMEEGKLSFSTCFRDQELRQKPCILDRLISFLWSFHCLCYW